MGSSNQTLLIGASAGGSGGGGDPNWDMRVASVPFNGAGGSQTFTDFSTYNHTFTPGTGTEPYLETSFSKFGNSCCSFQAGGVFRSADALAEFKLAGDFTIAFWATGDPSFSSFHLELTPIDGGDEQVWIDCGSGLLRAKMRFAIISGAVNFPVTGDWHHIAYRRSGTTVTLWVDGVQLATGTNSWAHVNSQFSLSGNGFFIDELQIWNGVARDIPAEFARTEPHPNFGGSSPPPATNKAAALIGSRATLAQGLASLAVTANSVDLIGRSTAMAGGVLLLPNDKAVRLQGFRAAIQLRQITAVNFGPAAFVHNDRRNPENRQREIINATMEAYAYLDHLGVIRYQALPQYVTILFWLDGKTSLVVEHIVGKMPTYATTSLDDWLTVDSILQLYAEGNYTLEQLAPTFAGVVAFTVNGFPWSLRGSVSRTSSSNYFQSLRAGTPLVGRGYFTLTPGTSGSLFVRVDTTISLEILRSNLPADVAGLFPSSAAYIVDFQLNLNIVNV